MAGLSYGRPYNGGEFVVAQNETIAFTYSHPQRPADIAIAKKGKTTQLTTLNEDALGYKTLATIKEINTKSSFDNRNIQAWVAYPSWL